MPAVNERTAIPKIGSVSHVGTKQMQIGRHYLHSYDGLRHRRGHDSPFGDECSLGCWHSLAGVLDRHSRGCREQLPPSSASPRGRDRRDKHVPPLDDSAVCLAAHRRHLCHPESAGFRESWRRTRSARAPRGPGGVQSTEGVRWPSPSTATSASSPDSSSRSRSRR